MPKFMRDSNGSLLFRAGYHELAWSRRTSSMPLFAVYLFLPSTKGEKEGRWILEYIGGTTKAPASYIIPQYITPKARFVGVLWSYWSNKGYLKVTLFYPPTTGSEEASSVSLYETEEFDWDTIIDGDALVEQFLDDLRFQLQVNAELYNSLNSLSPPEQIEIPKTIFREAKE